MLDILTRRKREKELLKIIYNYEPEAFVVVYEPKMFKGGYLTEIMRKRMKSRKKFNSIHRDRHFNVIKRAYNEFKNETNVLKQDWKKR